MEVSPRRAQAMKIESFAVRPFSITLM